MNDAPTITASALSPDAPSLNAKAIADLAEQLSQLLRLRTFPIGMKGFADLEAMANVPGLRRPPRGKTFSTCQLVTQARMAGFTLGITTENIPEFSSCSSVIGLDAPGEIYTSGRKMEGVWFENREAAAAQGTATEPTVQSPLIANQPPLIFIAWMGHNAYATAVRAAKDLRTAGFPVEVPPTELKFGKALGQADKLGAQFALILGENEISEGLWTLKNLTDGNQLKLSEPDLIAHLRSL